MITRTTAYTIDLDSGTVETRWEAPLTYGDKGADKIQVTLTRGSSPATLSGLSVMLYGVRSDGITAINAGSVSGNVVTAELDYTFYAIPGRLELLLQLTEGTTVVNTPLRITAYVKAGQTDAVVSTGEQFSLAELQAVVSACQSATSSATSAATSANGAATAANTAAGNAQDAADAITGITVGATAVPYGNPPTAVVTEDPGDGHLNVAFGLPTGATGIRGSVTYSGTAITGTSTTPTAYATGIAAAIAGDRYRYNGTVAANVGNEYVCTLGGNATTALWTYDSNVRGAPGTGSVNSVDGVSPDINGKVLLNAVKYTSMILSDTDKGIARTNIDAQKTLSSTNLLPVTGGGTGATTAADARANLGLTLDSTPVSGSANPVSSGGVFSALAQKQNTLTFDSTPVSGSANPVRSGGVFSAVAERALVLYSNDTAANARALLLAKVSHVTDKPDGCYLIYGGWSGNAFGISLIEKADSGNAYVVMFFSGDKAYQAYIYNSSGTLTIGAATQFTVTSL